MNILCISKYASIPKYGAAARLFYLAKEFSSAGHDVSMITSDSNHLCEYPSSKSTYNFEDVDGVKVCWINTKKYIRTASVSRVLSWFDFEWKLFRFNIKKVAPPHIVIVSSLSLLSIFYGYYLKRKFSIPLVFEVRDIWPLTLTEEGGVSKFHPLVLFLGAVERFAYRVSDMIVGTMPNLGQHVKEVIKTEKKVFCAPLGFDSSEESLDLESFSNPFEHEVPSNKRVIGYAGSMGISNALDNYIEVIKKFSSNEQVFFVLVGAGDLKQKYQKELEGFKNVKFLDKIPQADVKFFLAKCDLLYLSTHYSKVWDYGQSMNKVVQYMLAGKPIVASYAGYPSMINEADCGSYVNSKNAGELFDVIEKYASLDVQNLSSIGLKGKHWIEKQRNYKLLAKKYLEQLCGLVGGDEKII